MGMFGFLGAQESTITTTATNTTTAPTATTTVEGPTFQVLGGGGDGLEGDSAGDGDDEDGCFDSGGDEEAEDYSMYEGGRGGRKRVGRKRVVGVERDKWGKIIRVCGIEGCSYKTGEATTMSRHKAAKHGIGEYVRKIPNDGKERDKCGNLIRVCGID